jgi:hypothetical protein
MNQHRLIYQRRRQTIKQKCGQPREIRISPVLPADLNDGPQRRHELEKERSRFRYRAIHETFLQLNDYYFRHSRLEQQLQTARREMRRRTRQAERGWVTNDMEHQGTASAPGEVAIVGRAIDV